MATVLYSESLVVVVFSTLSYVVLEAPSTSGPLCQMLPDLYDLGVDTYMVSLILSHYLKARRKPSGLFMGSQLLAGALILSSELPLITLDSLSPSPSLLRKKGHW